MRYRLSEVDSAELAQWRERKRRKPSPATLFLERHLDMNARPKATLPDAVKHLVNALLGENRDLTLGQLIERVQQEQDVTMSRASMSRLRKALVFK